MWRGGRVGYGARLRLNLDMASWWGNPRGFESPPLQNVCFWQNPPLGASFKGTRKDRPKRATSAVRSNCTLRPSDVYPDRSMSATKEVRK
jgi:hypothetical protein